MANTNAPQGFGEFGRVAGSAPNFGLASGKMAYNASATYNGDPVILSGGKLAVGTATGNTGAPVAGIARSFSWVSIAQSRRVWQSYYPGSDSQGNADVDVWYDNDPQGLFIVQSSGTAIAQADVGKGINFATGVGSTYSGLSAFSADQTTLNATLGALPFIVRQIVQAPKSDPTSSYNLIVVGLNAPTAAG